MRTVQLFIPLVTSNDKIIGITFKFIVMKKISIFAVCLVLFLAVCYATSGHLHLPGHGNVEKQNLREAVINHISSTLSNGEKVEFVGNSGNDYFKEDGEARFSTNVSYYVVSPNGSKVKHTSHIITNDDRDKILEWKDI